MFLPVHYDLCLELLGPIFQSVNEKRYNLFRENVFRTDARRTDVEARAHAGEHHLP